MGSSPKIIELDSVVVRFAGDSGDGMQFTGSEFTFTAALEGNDLATFPDYPAEIRAPKGTIEGISGFQIQMGRGNIHTPGDKADVLVAMNPAALKADLHWVRKGGTIILDADTFSSRNLSKAGYDEDPRGNGILQIYQVVSAPISSMSKKALDGMGLDTKTVGQSKNMFALGITYWMFSRSMKQSKASIRSKFAKRPELAEANVKSLEAGYYYAENVEAFASHYKVAKADLIPGRYRQISGNVATAWGLLAARECLGLKLFYGSYPITPASDILHELAKHKKMGVITLQAEDEIAAVVSAIGASYAGHIGVTASSGPGVALKGEALGLAIMTELPLVLVDVQRAGPSTGMPTKTEQGDFFQVVFGRNADSPLIVLAPNTPSDCFRMAFESVRLAVEHMTPVVLLSDAYLANGSEPWEIPSMDDFPEIRMPEAPTKAEGQKYLPYQRDAETLIRSWAVPGMEGFEHRIGGLEKEEGTGNVSYDPLNHEQMIRERQEKVDRVAKNIPKLEVVGPDRGELLVVGWGSSYGPLVAAVNDLNQDGHPSSLANFSYLSPLPENTDEVFSRFNKILVCELNLGQFAFYLRAKVSGHSYFEYHKIQGLPFTVTELKEQILKHQS